MLDYNKKTSISVIEGEKLDNGYWAVRISLKVFTDNPEEEEVKTSVEAVGETESIALERAQEELYQIFTDKVNRLEEYYAESKPESNKPL